MKYFYIDDGEGGKECRRVPKGKTLADFGYSAEQISGAVELKRPPKDNEKLNDKGEWQKDEEADQKYKRFHRAKAMSRVDLLDLIEGLAQRVKALEERN